MNQPAVLFSIVCDSCLAKLKVTQRSAIGQVLACPKCSNMVNVEPPKDWTVPHNDSNLENDAKPESKNPKVASEKSQPTETSTSENFDEIDAILAGQSVPAKQSTPVQRNPSISDSRILTPQQKAIKNVRKQPNPTQSSPAQTKQVQNGAAVGTTAKPTKSAVTDTAVLPTDQWVSQHAKQKQKWLLLIFGLLAILVSATVLAFALISSLFSDPTEVVSNDKDSPNNSNTGDNVVDEKNQSEPIEDPESKKTNDVEPDDGSGTDNPNLNESNSDSDLGPDENTNTDTNTDNTSTENNDPDSNDPENINPENTDPETPIENLPDDGAENEIIAPENDQPSASIDDINALPPGSEFLAPDDENLPPSILDELSDMDGIDNNMGLNNSIDQMYADEREEWVGLSRIYVEKPQPIEIRVDRQRDLVIHGIRSEVNLAGFADKFFLLTRIPVTIDIDSIIASGFDPKSKFNIEAIEKPASEIAIETIEKLNLVFEFDGNGARISVPGFSEMNQQAHDIPSVELFSDEELVGLAESIRTTIYPSLWVTNGGESSLEIVNKQIVCRSYPAIHFQIQKLLNKLRSAGEFKAQPEDETALKAIRTNFQRYQVLENITLTKNHVMNVRLGTIINEIEKNHGVTILFDWARLESEGWNPEIELPWDQAGNSIPKMLNEVCHAMRLRWRIVGDNMVLISTRDAILDHMDIEVYPRSMYANLKLNDEQLMRVLEGQFRSLVSRIPTAVISYQEKFDCVVAVLPQDVQLQLAKSLDRLNGNGE